MQSATSSSHEGASRTERQTHRLELGSQVLTQEGDKHTLADAADAQQCYQAAVLLHDPLGQFGHFHLAAGEVAHVERSHPVNPREGCGLWGEPSGRRRGPHHSSTTGLFDCGRWGRRPGQQGREPGFIEEHSLMRRFPQCADLLFLPLWLKDVLLHTQHNNVLQMGGFGIVAAGLPLADRAAGDPQQGGQAGLRQANAHA